MKSFISSLFTCKFTILLVLLLNSSYSTRINLRELQNVVEEDTIKCQRFYCETHVGHDAGVCAIVSNPDLTNGAGVTVKLLTNSCTSQQFCGYWESWNSQASYQYSCSDGSASETDIYDNSRYPGEVCLEDKDCKGGPKTCNSNYICDGQNENQSCTATSDCIVGLYCEKPLVDSDGTCKPQKILGESCDLSEECSNNLLCWNGTQCVELYSLENGVNSFLNQNDQFLLYDSTLLCKSGHVDNSFVCTENEYAKEMTVVDDYVKCEVGATCRYKESNNSYTTKICECGFNSEGYAYCPIPTSVSK